MQRLSLEKFLWKKLQVEIKASNLCERDDCLRPRCDNVSI